MSFYKKKGKPVCKAEISSKTDVLTSTEDKNSKIRIDYDYLID
jgi:hypothetical protein